jgi:hypothetical protein
MRCSLLRFAVGQPVTLSVARRARDTTHGYHMVTTCGLGVFPNVFWPPPPSRPDGKRSDSRKKNHRCRHLVRRTTSRFDARHRGVSCRTDSYRALAVAATLLALGALRPRVPMQSCNVIRSTASIRRSGRFGPTSPFAAPGDFVKLHPSFLHGHELSAGVDNVPRVFRPATPESRDARRHGRSLGSSMPENVLRSMRM